MEKKLIFNNIKSFLGPQVWKYFWYSFFIGIFLFFAESFFIVIIQGFFNSIGLTTNGVNEIPAWYPTGLKSSLFLFILFGIIRALSYTLKAFITCETSNLFIRLQRSRVVFYGLKNANQTTTSNVYTYFTERINQAGSVLQNSAQLSLTIVSTFLFLCLGLSMSPVEMIVGFLSVALFVFPLKYFNKKIKEIGIDIRHEWVSASDKLSTSLKNHFLLVLYKQIDQTTDDIHSSLKKYESNYRSFHKITSFKNNFPNLVGILVICLITYVSVTFMKRDGVVLISFFYIFIRFTQGVSEINSCISEIRLQWGSIVELYEWIESNKKTEKKISSNKKYIDLDCNLKSFDFFVEDLGFNFEGTDLLFNKLNFTISKGEILLIKGPTGSGKSTLLLLLLGILKPTKGKVKINGNAPEMYGDRLSNYIAYVGPEPYMVVGTIKDNLLFGNCLSEKISDLDIEKSLQFAEIFEPHLTTNYFVNEQAALSTGQKQRISIARAILRKPNILILDEATANLDKTTEQNIINNLNKIKKDLTTIIISHKSSYDNIANSIIKLT